MKKTNKRREFLKIGGLGSAGLLMGGMRTSEGSDPFQYLSYAPPRERFNMHGYAAPALERVGVAVIGLGNRGSGTVRRMASIEGVDIQALCDLEPERVNASVERLEDTPHNPDRYSGGEEEWKRVCERDDIDLICIATPWHLHTPMATYVMEHEKHAFVELPAAQTIEDCWRLVETSERTRRHCVQESSNCHGGMRAVVLNMARQGLFGELVHGEGAYIHDLLTTHNFTKDQYHNNWRLKENLNRNGNLYPPHGFTPVAQLMDLNYGDQLDYMVSLSSNDFMMGDTAKKLAEQDPFWEPYTGWDYRGNINTSIIRTHKGRSIVLQHDVTTPRPGVRFDMISGTKGMYAARPDRIGFSYYDGWISDEEFNSLVEEYTPEINKRFNELVSQARESVREGHSYYTVNPLDWRLIDCLRNGLPLEMDVYDAALTSSIVPLSEWSVANRSHPVDVPDFTGGAWKTNKRGLDINIEQGGTTRLV